MYLATIEYINMFMYTRVNSLIFVGVYLLLYSILYSYFTGAGDRLLDAVRSTAHNARYTGKTRTRHARRRVVVVVLVPPRG